MALVPSNPSPYWNPDLAKQKALDTYLQGASNSLGHDYYVAPIPKFDYLGKAQKFSNNAAQSTYNNAINYANSFGFNGDKPPSINGGISGVAGGGGGAGGYSLRAILNALAGQESGGNYGAVNSSSGAMGKYQVMPANIQGPGGWDKEALGKNISTQQFLQNKNLQEAIVRYKFGNYLKQYGLRGALSAWYSGDPSLWNNKNSQGNYPSIYNYVMQVIDRLNG